MCLTGRRNMRRCKNRRRNGLRKERSKKSKRKRMMKSGRDSSLRDSLRCRKK
jgi:hypothetical protein